MLDARLAVPLVVALAFASLPACSCSTGNGNGNHVDASGGVDTGRGAMDANDLVDTATDTGGSATMDAAPSVDGGPTSMHVATCPGCPCFPGTDCSSLGDDSGTTTDAGPPPACTGASATPTLVYPPDGVLLPPNTNVIEVQYLPGAGNTLFEIDFANSRTDVRVITRCDPITSSRGMATGGCTFSLTNDQWRWVADVNRGGDPVHVTVRASDGTCVASTASRDISFATEDVEGVVYYWQSVTVGGTPGRAGGIYRFDFGRTDVAPEAFLESTPATGSRCYGCHFLSRDGLRISYGTDDPDSDDEYGDLTSRVMDIETRTISATIPAGFRTFTHDHASLLDSDGRDRNTPPAFTRVDGTTGAVIDHPPTGMRVTHPDWSADDSLLVYAQPTSFLDARARMVANADDDHFVNASLFTMHWDGSAFGTPTPLLMAAADENDYYPAFTPDGAFVIFNRVLGHTGVEGDAFSNPHARIWAMPTAGGAPVDLARMNQGDDLMNSWPRTSPFVQHDRGRAIVWVTFSSTRDYGLRVINQDPNGVACYPPESPENQTATHSCPLVPASCACVTAGCTQFCIQPQLWMAAVALDDLGPGGIASGHDPSWPAFWLPFQDPTAHNHVAQWAATIPTTPSGDAGTPPSDAGSDAPVPSCGGLGATCGAGSPLCCAAFYCTSTGTCAGLM